MKSRRTFIKMLAGMSAFIIPWTILPRYWGQKIENLIGKPAVKLDLSAAADPDRQRPAPEVLAKKAYDDILALSHPDMQGRRAGTAGETKALVYIQEQLESLGLKAFGEERYWQMFSIPPMLERYINGRALFRPDESDSLRIPAANILAGISGRNQNETLIISAHYDHLGIYDGKLCPGANDNASGVGCIFQVMRLLVQDSLGGSQPRLNVVAAFWSAEEMGFLGSKHFVKNPTIPLSQIKGVINYDTVGNGEKKDFILWQVGKSPYLDSIRKSFQNHKAEIQLVEGQGHHSDEISFSDTGIPAVTVLSRDWLLKNHTPSDDITLINQEKLATACTVLYDVVKEIAY